MPAKRASVYSAYLTAVLGFCLAMKGTCQRSEDGVSCMATGYADVTTFGWTSLNRCTPDRDAICRTLCAVLKIEDRSGSDSSVSSVRPFPVRRVNLLKKSMGS
jgi:hypothetical protein